MSRPLLALWSFQDNFRNLIFHTTMESLWKENFLSDVTVYCGDMSFTGHKIMLAANSPYFKKLFERVTGNEVTIVPENEKCSPKAVMFLLNFIYSKKIDIEINDKAELLAATSLLEMDYVIQIVLNDIINNFCSSNFLNDWDLIELHDQTDCKNKFLMRVVQSFGTVIEHDEFLNLSRDRIVSILECMHRESLWQIIPTEQLTKGVLKWVRFTSTREPFLPELISLIGIDKLSLPWIITLAEEEPSLSSIMIKPLCKRLWLREEVFVFYYTALGDVLKTKNNTTSLPLKLLNPATNLWLTVPRQLPIELREGSICNWQQYIYFITETSITIYNIETQSVSDIKCKLSCFDPKGKSVATEETLYFILKNQLKKYDLKSKEEFWITLPAPLKDILSPNTFCADGHIYVITNNLLIQRFKFATNEWELVESFLLEDENTNSNVVFYFNEVKNRLYVHRSGEPDVLQILYLKPITSSERNLGLGKKQLGSKCPLVDVRLMRVEEISFPEKFKLLMVDSKGKQWTYTEDSSNGSLIPPSRPTKTTNFSFTQFGTGKVNFDVPLSTNQDNSKMKNEKQDGFTAVHSFELGRRVFINASMEPRLYTNKKKDQSNSPSQEANLQTYRPDFVLAEPFIGHINFNYMSW